MDFLNCFIIWDKFVNVKFIFYYHHENTNLFKKYSFNNLKKMLFNKILAYPQSRTLLHPNCFNKLTKANQKVTRQSLPRNQPK